MLLVIWGHRIGMLALMLVSHVSRCGGAQGRDKFDKLPLSTLSTLPRTGEGRTVADKHPMETHMETWTARGKVKPVNMLNHSSRSGHYYST